MDFLREAWIHEGRRNGHTDRILGFTAFGPEAEDLEGAVQTAMLAEQAYTILRDAIFAHPTMMEASSTCSPAFGSQQEKASKNLRR